MSSTFMNVDEVAQELEISKAYAYKIVRLLNEELKKMGYMTVSAKVSRKFFLKKMCYGEYGTVEKEG